jgi:hypothetical protein
MLWENLMGKCYGKFNGEMLRENDVQQGLFYLLQNIPVSKDSQNFESRTLRITVIAWANSRVETLL